MSFPQQAQTQPVVTGADMVPETSVGSDAAAGAAAGFMAGGPMGGLVGLGMSFLEGGGLGGGGGETSSAVSGGTLYGGSFNPMIIGGGEGGSNTFLVIGLLVVLAIFLLRK